ncbi:MAG: hypothetical protein ACRD2L_07580 [Terriglobia bacterium]
MSKEHERFIEPVPSPEETKPAGPSVEELLSQRDAEVASLKGQMAEKEAAFEGRFQGLERLVGDQFRASRQAPSAPVAPESSAAYAAAQELGITDDELLARPAESVRKIAEQISARERAKLSQEFGTAYQNLAVTAFNSQVDALRGHAYFADLQDSLIEYFRENTGEIGTAGQVRRVFHELVGTNLEELQRRQEARKALAAVPAETVVVPEIRKRAVEPSLKIPTAAPAIREDAKPTIDGAESLMMEAFNKVKPGLFKNEAEWAEVAEGRKFPKMISSDIQTGRQKPNVNY